MVLFLIKLRFSSRLKSFGTVAWLKYSNLEHVCKIHQDMSPIDIYRYLKSFFKFLNGKSVFHVARDGTAILYGSKNCHWKMIPIQKCLDRDIIVYSFGLGEDIGSTPKSVDFNERRRIGQVPSIDNFQSFCIRRLGVVLASSCGGSPR